MLYNSGHVTKYRPKGGKLRQAQTKVTDFWKAAKKATVSSIVEDNNKHIFGRHGIPYPKRVVRSRSKVASGRTQHIGKFKKPKSTDSSRGKYGFRGATATLEACGKISDPDCVYIGHSSHSAYLTARTAVQSLIRTLLKMGILWDAPDVNKVVPNNYVGSSYSQSNELRITIDTTTGNGVTVTNDSFDCVIPIDQNINTIAGYLTTYGTAGWAGIVNAGSFAPGARLLEWFLALAQPGALMVPKSIRLYQSSVNSSLGFIHTLLACIDLQEVMVHTMSTSQIKVQNRSINNTGDTEADEVDNVPLNGRTYDIAGYSPLCRSSNLFNGVSTETAMLAVGAAAIATGPFGVDGFKEPPLKGVFTNCKKVGSIMINPGDVKTDSLSFKRSFSFYNMFSSMYTSASTIGQGLTQASSPKTRTGSHRLLALEKMVNVRTIDATVLPISVIFETNLWTGTYITIKKRLSMMNVYDTALVINT